VSFERKEALLIGGSIDTINELTGIDKFYLNQFNDIVNLHKELKNADISKESKLTESLIREAKQYGFSDAFLAELFNLKESEIRLFRKSKNIIPSFSEIGNFGGVYSTYKIKKPFAVKQGGKIIIGSGPSRIGQGNEYDYSVVHCAETVRSHGSETVIINSNPAAVSTDCTLYNKVYIEPVTLEHILNICEVEKPSAVITSFGGNNPYVLSRDLHEQGFIIPGYNEKALEIIQNKSELKMLLDTLNIAVPVNGEAMSNEEAQAISERVGYPIIVRPVKSVGGRGMEIIHESEGLRRYMIKLPKGEKVKIEKFLTDAIELEVDAVCSEREVYIPEIIEHIEYAGIHSGDSDCVIPSSEKINSIIVIEATKNISKALNVKGLINIKYALQDNRLYLLELELRSSRSIPLLSKVTGVDIVKLSTEVLLSDKSVGERKIEEARRRKLNYYGIKAAVFPFEMFHETDPMLGPEMKSTGSVLGIASSVGEAFYKAQAATDTPIPNNGTVMISVDDSKKQAILPVAKEFINLGFKVLATSGTYNFLKKAGVIVNKIDKMYEGRPNIADAMINGEVDLLVNTPSGIKSEYDDSFIRKIAIRHRICYITTVEAANAAISGVKEAKAGKCTVRSLQSYYRN